MTLVLAGMIDDSVVMCADRRVTTSAFPDCFREDDKLVVVNRIAVATYGVGPADHVPTRVRALISSCSSAMEAASAIAGYFGALEPRPQMEAFVGGCANDGLWLWRVEIASKQILPLVLQLGEGHRIWPGGAPIPSELHDAQTDNAEGMLEHMLKIERAVAEHNLAVGGPFDTVILRPSARPVVQRVAAFYDAPAVKPSDRS